LSDELLDALDWTRESIDESLGNLFDAWRYLEEEDITESMDKVKALLSEALVLVDGMMQDLSDDVAVVSFDTPKLSKFTTDGESDE
jgi:hypothetical protein